MLGRLYHLLVSFMLLGAGCLLLYGAAGDHLKAYESLRWPERPATVVQEHFGEDSSIEVVSVLDGIAVRQRVPFSYALSFAHESQRARVRLKARYAQGNEVTIRYNARAPDTEAVLRPGFPALSVALMGTGAVFLLAGLVIALRPPPFLSRWFYPAAVQPAGTAYAEADARPLPHSPIVSRGRGFELTSDGTLTSTVIDRRKAVTAGLIFLGVFAWLFYLDWQGLLVTTGWASDAIAMASVASLGLGLTAIGLHKKVMLSRSAARAWVESGWFAFSTSARQTSAWRLAAFDRVVIARVNLLGFESRAPRSAQRGGPGIRFRVTLLGDSDLPVNSYRSYQNALKLAYCLSGLTGYRVVEMD